MLIVQVWTYMHKDGRKLPQENHCLDWHYTKFWVWLIVMAISYYNLHRFPGKVYNRKVLYRTKLHYATGSEWGLSCENAILFGCILVSIIGWHHILLAKTSMNKSFEVDSYIFVWNLKPRGKSQMLSAHPFHSVCITFINGCWFLKYTKNSTSVVCFVYMHAARQPSMIRTLHNTLILANTRKHLSECMRCS